MPVLDFLVRVIAGALILMFVLVMGKAATEWIQWLAWRWEARHRVTNRRKR